MPDPIYITLDDSLLKSGKHKSDPDEFKVKVKNLAPSADVNDANDIYFSDGGDLSDGLVQIKGFGKKDGEADTFNFDINEFDDDFSISIKSEDASDNFIFNKALSSSVDGGGVYTITYIGSDGNTHTVTVDPGSAGVIVNVVCLTPDVRVSTPSGPRRVGDLQVGDEVMTRDHGAQPLRWIGRRRIVFPKGPHKHKPILISKGAVDGRVPAKDVLLSPQHRILLQGPAVEKATGEAEVLAPAKALAGLSGVRVATGKDVVDYISLMFDHHEIIEAEGMPTESFLPRPYAATFLPTQAVAEVAQLFPGVFSEKSEALYPPARPIFSVRAAKEFAEQAMSHGTCLA